MGTGSESGREKKRGMTLALECRHRRGMMLEVAKWFRVTARRGGGSGEGWERGEDEKTRKALSRGARQHCICRQLRCLISTIHQPPYLGVASALAIVMGRGDGRARCGWGRMMDSSEPSIKGELQNSQETAGCFRVDWLKLEKKSPLM